MREGSHWIQTYVCECWKRLDFKCGRKSVTLLVKRPGKILRIKSKQINTNEVTVMCVCVLVGSWKCSWVREASQALTKCWLHWPRRQLNFHSGDKTESIWKAEGRFINGCCLWQILSSIANIVKIWGCLVWGGGNSGGTSFFSTDAWKKGVARWRWPLLPCFKWKHKKKLS